MGEEEQKLLDDLIQENEVLTEQVDFFQSLAADMFGELDQTTRILLYIPSEQVDKARERIALEDGTEMLRRLHETG